MQSSFIVYLLRPSVMWRMKYANAYKRHRDRPTPRHPTASASSSAPLPPLAAPFQRREQHADHAAGRPCKRQPASHSSRSRSPFPRRGIPLPLPFSADSPPHSSSSRDSFLTPFPSPPYPPHVAIPSSPPPQVPWLVIPTRLQFIISNLPHPSLSPRNPLLLIP